MRPYCPRPPLRPGGEKGTLTGSNGRTIGHSEQAGLNCRVKVIVFNGLEEESHTTPFDKAPRFRFLKRAAEYPEFPICVSTTPVRGPARCVNRPPRKCPTFWQRKRPTSGSGGGRLAGRGLRTGFRSRPTAPGVVGLGCGRRGGWGGGLRRVGRAAGDGGPEGRGSQRPDRPARRPGGGAPMPEPGEAEEPGRPHALLVPADAGSSPVRRRNTLMRSSRCRSRVHLVLQIHQLGADPLPARPRLHPTSSANRPYAESGRSSRNQLPNCQLLTKSNRPSTRREGSADGTELTEAHGLHRLFATGAFEDEERIGQPVRDPSEHARIVAADRRLDRTAPAVLRKALPVSGRRPKLPNRRR